MNGGSSSTRAEMATDRMQGRRHPAINMAQMG